MVIFYAEIGWSDRDRRSFTIICRSWVIVAHILSRSAIMIVSDRGSPFGWVIVKWLPIKALQKNTQIHIILTDFYSDTYSTLLWKWKKKTCKITKMIGNCMIHWEMDFFEKLIIFLKKLFFFSSFFTSIVIKKCSAIIREWS